MTLGVESSADTYSPIVEDTKGHTLHKGHQGTHCMGMDSDKCPRTDSTVDELWREDTDAAFVLARLESGTVLLFGEESVSPTILHSL